MRVLLADDHPLVLDGLQNLLVSRGFEVVGSARDGYEAVDKARALHPDVVLMDICMPRLDGLSALRLIKAELPQIRVIMLTMSAEDENLFEAIKDGASGYLLKTQETQEFVALLAEVERGEVVFSPGLAVRILGEFSRRTAVPTAEENEPPASLSARQMQVLTLVADGLTYKEAAEKLHLSERTVKYHMSEILDRLHLRRRAQVVTYARSIGLAGWPVTAPLSGAKPVDK